jgi:cytochrome o ubiquinol oxidase operon protein cyoD
MSVAAAGHATQGHGSRAGYLLGFFASVILTGIPFLLVMNPVFADARITALLVMAFAAIQVVVHMVYFLHMNSRAEGGWTMLALIFTLVLVGITLSGSLWVMYNLNANMMPMTAQDMRNMP